VDEGRNIYGISLIYKVYADGWNNYRRRDLFSCHPIKGMFGERRGGERVDDVIRWRITAASILRAAFFSDK
jgi:hypothetical protein